MGRYWYIILVSLCLLDNPVSAGGAGFSAGAYLLKTQTLDYFQEGSLKLKMDIMQPAKKTNYLSPFPAIIMIHGGGWRSGSRQHMRMGLVASSKRAYVGIAVSYRLASLPHEKIKGTEKVYQLGANGFDQLRDIKRSILYIREHASELNIDPERIILMGTSAGAHLAMLAGLSANDVDFNQDLGFESRDDLSVAAIISWMGPVDPLANYRVKRSPRVDNVTKGLTGCRPSAAIEGSECLQRFLKLSPIAYMDAADPPVLTLHGNLDQMVSVSQGSLLQQRAIEVGSEHELQIFDQVGHKMQHSNGKKIHRLAWKHSIDFADSILKRPNLDDKCTKENIMVKRVSAKDVAFVCDGSLLNFSLHGTISRTLNRER